MIELVRQLLGCKQVDGSGYLESVPLTGQLSHVRTYGQLFLTLAYLYGMVPMGIYRTSEASYQDTEVRFGQDGPKMYLTNFNPQGTGEQGSEQQP